MHFRCVFTLLLYCVLVGLDWAEPMMHLYLHVTYSCIFMQTYLQVSIFVILYLVGAFLIVSLSLSPSLSVSYVSCVMAPKCKSILSWNPLRSGASSSSSPSILTPSHIRFRDEKAKSNFSENFSWCGIHSERHAFLSDFSDTDLPTIIYSRGWESLCGVPVML